MSLAAAPETAALTDSRLAALCAGTVQRAFSEYDSRFHAITRRARERFLARDWRGSYGDASERLHLYSEVLDELAANIRKAMGERLQERSMWSAIKAVYSALIAQSLKREIAESFFNSLTRRVFVTEGVDQAIEFVDTDFDEAPAGADHESKRLYSGASVPELIDAALTDPAVGFPVQHWAACAAAIHEAARRIDQSLGEGADGTRLEIIGNIFYRGRGAYLVGRAARDSASVPIALCLRHESERGIDFDAVLIGERDLAILFSFTRAYFRVEVACPYELVRNLLELMPHKRLIDLYNAIGYHRHGKTEFYRDFVRHLRKSSDCFVAAEGARGMVMLVFTLPSYDVVFKLIKDRFDYPKESTRAEVMRRYRLVF
ncbi:MAG TPA: isocitrate dehydrogenase kinase/phosphatase AceK regulatory subunit, partial [Chthoniobacterales bacterium]|nr:isocitrate dehydrogenase kinase/phosphatase AceK regulatory subunit [Chthoniobacterales bacterium]